MYPPLPKSDHVLPDGRRLSYAEYGRPNGTPIFLFHGTPGSRLFGRLGHNAAADRNVRLIVPDRPGFGRSTFQKGRTIGDWPADVVALADALGIEKFGVIGVSGGGPFAAACALKIPERLIGTGLVSAFAPNVRAATKGLGFARKTVLDLGRVAPLLLRPQMAMVHLIAIRYPERVLTGFKKAMPDSDKEVLGRSEVKETFVADLQEAVAVGGHGLAHESMLLSKPWGFKLEDISARVHIWQGDKDANVPIAMGRYYERLLPNASATFIQGAGHFWFVDHLGDVMDTITSP